MLKQASYYKGIAFMLFLFVFGYLLLRSILTEPLHDEIATFYYYIYHGDFVGRDLVFDANNHLLNSALGFVLYRVFGEHFFVFRLPNLLAFPLYFYAIYQLMQYVKSTSLRVLGLSALICIPFVLEYFAYSRGYGLGIAFFALSLHFLISYIRSERSRFLACSYLSTWLAIFANMIYINTSLLLLAFVMLWLMVNRKKLKTTILLSSLFVLGIAPFIFFAFKLKQAGALYYGSLDGLWNVTGESLSEMILFTGGTVVFVVTTIILCLLLFRFVQQLTSKSLNEQLKTPSLIITYFLVASLVLVLILALILNLNYPEDRTGMYLIPLFLCAIIYQLDTSSWVKHFKWGLLFFPLSFCCHLSIHSSIYSPDQRMSEAFFNKVKGQMKPSYSLGSYHMNFWTWNLMDSKENEQSSVLLFNHSDEPYYDVILGKKNTVRNPQIFEMYDTLAFDEATHDVAFIRKKPLKKELLFQSTGQNVQSDAEFITIFETDSLAQFPLNAPLQLSVDLSLKTTSKKNYIELVVQTLNAKGESIERMYYPIAFVYRNQALNKHMLHHFVLNKLASDTKAIKVYIWNKGNERIELSNGKCYFYVLD